MAQIQVFIYLSKFLFQFSVPVFQFSDKCSQLVILDRRMIRSLTFIQLLNKINKQKQQQRLKFLFWYAIDIFLCKDETISLSSSVQRNSNKHRLKCLIVVLEKLYLEYFMMQSMKGKTVANNIR